MDRQDEIEDKLWRRLKADRVVMLGLAGVENGHSQPMTAQFEHERGPLWFFSARDTHFVQELQAGKPAVAHFVAKDHDLFAALDGVLTPVQDRATVERLWNPFVAAWYEGGKDDPKLQLLRFDPARAQVWLNENSLAAGIKLLFGRDPKKEYADKVADVDLTKRAG